MGPAGDPLTGMSSMVDSPTGLGSDFILSFFLFFFGISVAIPRTLVTLYSGRRRSITHLGYHLLVG